MVTFKPHDRVILELDLSEYSLNECLRMMITATQKGIRQCIIRNLGDHKAPATLIPQFRAAGAIMVLVSIDDLKDERITHRIIEAGADFVIVGKRIMTSHPRKTQLSEIIREVQEGFTQ